jgi:hypothetical protein
MSRSKTRPGLRAAIAAVTLSAALAGCSGLYMNRTDSVAFSAGDAVAANKMAQMYDPWPAHSGNVNYGANGQRMQSAVERYRNNLVTPPVSPTTLQVANPTPTTQQAGATPNSAPPPSSAIAGGSNGSSNTASSIASGQ